MPKSKFSPASRKAFSPPAAAPTRRSLDYSGGTAEGQPSALQQVAAAFRRDRSCRRGRGRGCDRQRRPGAGRDRGQRRARQSRPQRPLLVRQRQEVQEVPRGLDPVREVIRAFNAGDLEALVAVLDPEVEIHSMKGLRKGPEAVRIWATRKPGGVQQTIELDELHEEGTESGGGIAVALVTRRWRWEGWQRGLGGRARPGLRAARAARSAPGAPSRTGPRACARAGFDH